MPRPKDETNSCGKHAFRGEANKGRLENIERAKHRFDAPKGRRR